MTDKPLLDVHDLSIVISGRDAPIRVVDGISLSVGKGEAVGVVGESGCGKSLTFLSLLGLLPHKISVAGGRAMFEGRDLLKLRGEELRQVRGGQVGFVFQDPMTTLNPVLRIGRQVTEALQYHRSISKEAARTRAVELLRLVGISSPEQRMNAYPHELSGGMRQRVVIAMALACEPQLLIADEPTTALDVTIQAQIVDLVKDLQARIGMSIVWITHDLALVAGLVDRIVVLYAGTVVENARVRDLYRRPLHPYTRGLLASLPRKDGEVARRLTSIGGSPPEPGKRPKGCAFAARCPLVIPVCHEQVPGLRLKAELHEAACFAVPDAEARAVA